MAGVISSKRTLVIFGATGAQGGSVLRAVLNHPKLRDMYRIKAVTRDPSKSSAAALAGDNVDVVKADMNDVHSLTTAVKGADVVFAVTAWFDTVSLNGEVGQGLNIVTAVQSTNAHLIFSSFPFADVMLPDLDKYNNIQQWKSKIMIEKAALDTLGPQRCSFVCCGGYMEDFKTLYRPQKTSSGQYVILSPFSTSMTIPLVNGSGDTGLFTAPILLDPARYAGKHINAVAESPTIGEIAATVAEVTKKNVVAKEVSERTFWDEQLPPEIRPLEPIMGGMFEFIKEHGLLGKNGEQGVQWSLQQIEGKPQTWREYVQDQGAWF